MKLHRRLMWSRYGWYLRGLPELQRAKALSRIRHNTMTTLERSRKLWDCSRAVLEKEISGDFVECGVWKGGSAGLMGLALEAFEPGSSRKLHLFDSFEGLPQPCAEDGERAAEYSGGVNSGDLVSVHQCEAGLDEVRDFLLNTLSLPSNRLVFHKGWFQETIPHLGTEPESIAVLRLDGDWYESTKVCLEHLYDRLTPGGIVILDDYFCWEGCKKATDEYRLAHNISYAIIPIDKEAAYWLKSN